MSYKTKSTYRPQVSTQLPAHTVNALLSLKAMEECPNRAEHTEGPTGYVQWHAWAERMAKTHVQSKCPGCGLWVIVTPKGDGEPVPESDDDFDDSGLR